MKLKKPKLLENYHQQFLDQRGFLNPMSLSKLLQRHDLEDFDYSYQLISMTEHMNTFRGFHFQKPPDEQTKILIMHSGEVLDIVFPFDDVKKENIETFNLKAGDILLIPNNYAHGFYTCSNNVLIQYIMNKEYNPESYTGFNGLDFICKKMNRQDILISPNDLSLPQLGKKFSS
jgi:dTDP-4-dehydrorhamnose 3,5-epimerase